MARKPVSQLETLCFDVSFRHDSHDMAQASKKEAYLAKDDSDDEIEEVHFLSVYTFFSVLWSFSMRLCLCVQFNSLVAHGRVISYTFFKQCPLCMEPLDPDDMKFFPCTCGYQVSNTRG